jgi:hypothetical protein
MSATTHRFRAAEARRVKHPVFPEIEKHYMLVRAVDVPEGIRKDANARESTGLNRRVYKDVQRSLLADQGLPGIFDLKNKGIVILADSVKKIGDDLYEVQINDGQGIVDGGHTYEIIVNAQVSATIPDDQYVEVQVRTGVPVDLITEISSGLNTGIAVKAHSIANLDGKYEWIKEELAGEKYYKRIAWRESDEGDYDVRDMISVLEAMNVVDFPNDSGTHPIAAYEAVNRVAEKFSADAEKNEQYSENSTYRRLRPILKEALQMFDVIRRDFRDVYNGQKLGSAGALDIMEKAAKDKTFDFPFSGREPSAYRLTKGALYPLFAAFRNKVQINKQTGLAEWEGGFQSVLDLWQTCQIELVTQTQGAIKDYGRKPDILGKSRGHWNNVHKTVEVKILRALRDS